jgi:hypothetical protein
MTNSAAQRPSAKGLTMKRRMAAGVLFAIVTGGVISFAQMKKEPLPHSLPTEPIRHGPLGRLNHFAPTREAQDILDPNFSFETTATDQLPEEGERPKSVITPEMLALLRQRLLELSTQVNALRTENADLKSKLDALTTKCQGADHAK